MLLYKAIIIHPFLFAVFPALALLAYNVEEVALSVATRSLPYSLIAAVFPFLLALLEFAGLNMKNHNRLLRAC